MALERIDNVNTSTIGENVAVISPSIGNVYVVLIQGTNADTCTCSNSEDLVIDDIQCSSYCGDR